MLFCLLEPVRELPNGDEYRAPNKAWLDLDTEAGLYMGKPGLFRVSIEGRAHCETGGDVWPSHFGIKTWARGFRIYTPLFNLMADFSG